MLSAKWRPFCLSLNVLTSTRHVFVRLVRIPIKCLHLDSIKQKMNTYGHPSWKSFQCIKEYEFIGTEKKKSMNQKMNEFHLQICIWKHVPFLRNLICECSISMMLCIGSIHNVMAWYLSGTKQLSEPLTSKVHDAIHDITRQWWVNSLAPRRCGRNFKIMIFKLITWTDISGAACKIVVRLIPQNSIDDKSTLVQAMAWCR